MGGHRNESVLLTSLAALRNVRLSRIKYLVLFNSLIFTQVDIPLGDIIGHICDNMYLLRILSSFLVSRSFDNQHMVLIPFYNMLDCLWYIFGGNKFDSTCVKLQ